MSRLEITAAESGERADSLVSVSVEGLTRSAAQRLIDEGRLTVNGRAVKKNHRVSAGEVYVLELPEVQKVDIIPQDIPLDVVFEDEDIIVVNKPRGMVVHPAPGHPDGTLVNALLHHCGDSLSGINGEKRPGIVHRIDRDTSGLIISAKNDRAHLALAQQLENHSLSRIYEAVARGNIKEERVTIDAPIGRSGSDRKKMAVVKQGGRHAVTHCEVIARYAGYTHVRCILETGRTHQIRVHMAYRGNPLLGDIVYGGKKAEKGLEGQCLHARSLCFAHPRCGERIELTTGLPEYFTQVLTRLGTPV